MLDTAQSAERFDCKGLFICDHLAGRTEELARQPCLDPWVTLAAIAPQTRSVGLGTLVRAAGFRYPSIVAKMASTLFVIRNGRLNLSLGAGWYEPEYKSHGIPFPPLYQRIEQLREAIQIIRLMWTKDKATFRGKIFDISEAGCYPRPVQKPTPKIWVGGTSERDCLEFFLSLPMFGMKQRRVLRNMVGSWKY